MNDDEIIIEIAPPQSDHTKQSKCDIICVSVLYVLVKLLFLIFVAALPTTAAVVIGYYVSLYEGVILAIVLAIISWIGILAIVLCISNAFTNKS